VLSSVIAFFFFVCIMLVALGQADFTEVSDYDFFLLDKRELDAKLAPVIQTSFDNYCLQS